MGIKFGSVVRLASGGPKMTVTRVVDDRQPHDELYNRVYVTWFRGDQLVSDQFRIELLRLDDGQK